MLTKRDITRSFGNSRVSVENRVPPFHIGPTGLQKSHNEEKSEKLVSRKLSFSAQIRHKYRDGAVSSAVVAGVFFGKVLRNLCDF